jgi:23S rRNA (cytosine1962-C5)-methyltransferase
LGGNDTWKSWISQGSHMHSTPSEQPLAYELIDFGHGRKLESFAGVIVDRPCPLADCQPELPALWLSAQLIYEPSTASKVREGEWISSGKGMKPLIDEGWLLPTQSLMLSIKPQVSGQLGVFPEHWQQWPWFGRQLEGWYASNLARSMENELQEKTIVRVLHLFAYTGATTLALASMNAEVTHVDAMRSAVEWARENARLSQMEAYPIRWIVDDARAYVHREIKRERRYELIVLDPPSYGHGSRGQPWSIGRDLEPLLEACHSLLSQNAIGIVLSGHSPDLDLNLLRRAMPALGPPQIVRAIQQDRSGRPLDCGYVARFLTLPFTKGWAKA